MYPLLMTVKERSLKNWFSFLLLSIFISPLAMAENISDSESVNPCVSADENIGDSAFWASTAVQYFANQEYEMAISTVDACFDLWAPDAGHQQKKMNNKGQACPPVGKVKARTKRKIEKNFLVNDVSMALWAKARSLHESQGANAAIESYSQCVYMACGRAWDPKGWFWSPAEDCANKVSSLIN